MDMDKFLAKMVQVKASDLFITAGKPPCVKINGVVSELNEPPLTVEQARDLVLSIMDEKQQAEFLNHKELNFAIDSKQSGRFRISAFFERFNVGAVLRKIATEIPKLKDMGLPEIIRDLAMTKRGLIIVAGATGVGKSTTLAAMLGHRNDNSSGHIVTVEDPIEYVHSHNKCIITQREVGIDTESYAIALRNTLRQAPDIILIGEIRSSETMEYAIQFAETGHLCLATLHANNANQALDRIISFFPPIKREQVLLELSLNLKAMIAQQLIPTVDGNARVPAVEILLNTPIVQQCIRNGAISEIKQYMTKGGVVGMQTFDQALYALYTQNKIGYEEALRYADSENEVRLMIKMAKSVGSNKGDTSGGIKLQD